MIRGMVPEGIARHEVTAESPQQSQSQNIEQLADLVESKKTNDTDICSLAQLLKIIQQAVHLQKL